MTRHAIKEPPEEFTVTSPAAASASNATSVSEHGAPTELTVDQAHQLMQVHLRCATANCDARRSALALLVAKERYVLDPNSRRR